MTNGMSENDKPREWKLHFKDGSCTIVAANAQFIKHKDIIHVIEYSAYNQAIYEGDKAKEDRNKAQAENERLKRVIARDLSDNDDAGCEFTYVNILKDELACLNRQLENKSMEIGRSEHRGNTVDYIYDKCETYGNQLVKLGPELAAWKEMAERLARTLEGEGYELAWQDFNQFKKDHS